MSLGPSVTTELVLAVYAALWPVVLCTAGRDRGDTPTPVRRRAHVAFLRAITVRKIVIPAAVPAWLVGARLASGHRSARFHRHRNGHVSTRSRWWSGRIAQCARAGTRVGVRARLRRHRIRALRITRPRRQVRRAGQSGQCGHIGVSPERRRATPVALRGLLPGSPFLATWQLVGMVSRCSFRHRANGSRRSGHVYVVGVAYYPLPRRRFRHMHSD